MALSFLGGVLQKAEWFLYPAWRVLCVYRHQYIIYGAGPRDLQPVAITERSHNV